MDSSFLEVQGHRIHKNTLCQDNKSAILLEENGKEDVSKTQAIILWHQS